ncbi:MAG: 3'-5' exonuclease [Saprospiraceae bacterium]|jgi:DNA polymerase-3 subunit epsilon|nr:3'-5' exonuclease [Saprospiraceae bacterium]
MDIPKLEVPLQRDICFFDLETTGLNVVKDRIVQIAVVKYFKSGKDPITFNSLINPGVPISEESSAIHGITASMVANKPSFQDIGDTLWKLFDQADIGGYNSARFDIPLLMEEFARIGKELDMSHRSNIDVQRIFYKMEPRTLKAALKFYCQKEIVNAHNALEDVVATIEVFNGQLTKYEGIELEDEDGVKSPSPIVRNIKELHKFTDDLSTIDGTQKLKFNANKEVVFNFGKYAERLVGKTCFEDKNFYNWLLEKEFTHQVKKIVQAEYKKYEKTQFAK